MEISWNFVSPKKWEPCFIRYVLFHFRSWDKVFCVLDGKRLAMYKDQKHAKTVSTMGRVHK